MAEPAEGLAPYARGTELSRNRMKCMGQLCHILKSWRPDLGPELSGDGLSIQSTTDSPPREGILAVAASILDDQNIGIQLTLARAEPGWSILMDRVWNGLADLREVYWMCTTEPDQDGLDQYSVILRIKAEPLGYQHEARLISAITKVDGLAKLLQTHLPDRSHADSRLEELYKSVPEIIPVYPLPKDLMDPQGLEWAKRVATYLLAGHPVCMAGDPPEVDYGLSLLASVGQESDLTLGEWVVPGLSWRTLTDGMDKAPGVLVVSASSIAMGTNRYEVVHDSEISLQLLSRKGRPVILTGTRDNLRSIFSGQGLRPDPTIPIVVDTPKASQEHLLRHCLMEEARRVRLSKAAADSIHSELRTLDWGTDLRQVTRTLRSACRYAVALQQQGVSSIRQRTATFLHSLSACRDTVSGLSRRIASSRPADVTYNFCRLTEPTFAAWLRSHLYGQDQAIDEMTLRLQAQVLARPDHQPLSLLAQGTPATGKSRSMELMAEYLGIPYVQVDCASLSDTYAASTQLFGGARGLVGSDQPGRLEEAALSPFGAVVEISDLDHAAPPVRAQLADQFLQALDTGEAQSGTGKVFSCSKLILGFSVNLPEGRDETLRSGFGFAKEPTREQVKDTVRSELRRMLSGAFVSRVGDPILFTPLDRMAYMAIVSRQLEDAVRTGISRLGYTVGSVRVTEDAASRLVAWLQIDPVSTGARGLAECARMQAAKAVLRFRANHRHGFSGKICVKPYDGEELIQIVEE